MSNSLASAPAYTPDTSPRLQHMKEMGEFVEALSDVQKIVVELLKVGSETIRESLIAAEGNAAVIQEAYRSAIRSMAMELGVEMDQ